MAWSRTRPTVWAWGSYPKVSNPSTEHWDRVFTPFRLVF
jgi:hypothetical protein